MSTDPRHNTLLKKYLLQLKNQGEIFLSDRDLKLDRKKIDQKEVFVIPSSQKQVISKVELHKKPQDKKLPEPLPSSDNKIIKKNTSIPDDAFVDLRSAIHRISPDLFIHQKPPSDIRAKEVKEEWKINAYFPAVPIFVGSETKQELIFLSNVTFAIKRMFNSSKVIDVKKIRDEHMLESIFTNHGLKLALITKKTLDSSPLLKSHYRELPNQKSYFLYDVPLFILNDISSYLQNSDQKKELWEKILNFFR